MEELQQLESDPEGETIKNEIKRLEAELSRLRVEGGEEEEEEEEEEVEEEEVEEEEVEEREEGGKRGRRGRGRAERSGGGKRRRG